MVPCCSSCSVIVFRAEMSVCRGLKLRTPRRAQGVNYYTLAPPDPPPDSCDRTSTRITSHFCDKLWVALGLQLQWEYWKRFKRLKGKLPERRKTKVTLVHVVSTFNLFLAPPPPPYLMYLSIFIRPLSVLSSCPFHFLSHQSFFSYSSYSSFLLDMHGLYHHYHHYLLSFFSF